MAKASENPTAQALREIRDEIALTSVKLDALQADLRKAARDNNQPAWLAPIISELTDRIVELDLLDTDFADLLRAPRRLEKSLVPVKHHCELGHEYIAPYGEHFCPMEMPDGTTCCAESSRIE